jgi:hypothetical protein
VTSATKKFKKGETLLTTYPVFLNYPIQLPRYSALLTGNVFILKTGWWPITGKKEGPALQH